MILPVPLNLHVAEVLQTEVTSPDAGSRKTDHSARPRPSALGKEGPESCGPFFSKTERIPGAPGELTGPGPASLL